MKVLYKRADSNVLEHTSKSIIDCITGRYCRVVVPRWAVAHQDIKLCICSVATNQKACCGNTNSTSMQQYALSLWSFGSQ